MGGELSAQGLGERNPAPARAALAIHAGGGRPSEGFAAFCGRLAVGWRILTPRDTKGALERTHGFLRQSFEPARSFANHLDYQDQLDRWLCERANPRFHRGIRARPSERLEAEPPRSSRTSPADRVLPSYDGAQLLGAVSAALAERLDVAMSSTAQKGTTANG